MGFVMVQFSFVNRFLDFKDNFLGTSYKLKGNLLLQLIFPQKKKKKCLGVIGLV